MNYRYIIVLLIASLFVHCNPNHTHDQEPAIDDHEMEDHDENEVELSMVQIENIGLEYGRLTPRKIQSTLKLTGRIEMRSREQ